jgi:aldehyde:ferredoxin oxidoreductase
MRHVIWQGDSLFAGGTILSNGYWGKILRVNLTDGTITTETPPEQFYRAYFGGRGLIAHYLLKEVPPGTDPLGPDNKFIVAPGVITGVPYAGSGRNSYGALSPLTGTYGEGEGGGFFGVELKRAGVDAIIFEGASGKPVYLWVHDGEAELRDASHLWGKTTGEVEDLVQEELGDKRVRVAQCGVAGENMSRLAAVCNDLTHYAGRAGLGAVMGSKKLKAVVARGTMNVPVADAGKVRELARWMVEHWHESSQGLHDHGTANGLVSLHTSGGLPTRNFQQGHFEGAEKISGQTMTEKILVERDTCFACPIRCKRVVKTGPPHNVDPKYGGPEYETLGSLGSVCGIDDLEAIAKGNELCNAYGLDTIGVGVTIAFAMECYENGLLTKEDTDGLELRFGNAAAMLELLEKITRRQGIGDLLAEGSYRAAQKIGKGAEQYAIHVKKQEVPMHEPRLKHALGVGYSLSPTGADHCHNIHDTGYTKSVGSAAGWGVLEPMPADYLGPEKVRLLMYNTIIKSANNCLVICQFVPWRLEHLAGLVEGITGWNHTHFELMKVGERAINLTRIFNLRHGFGADEDNLTERFFKPFKDGPLAGVGVDRDAWKKAKVTYYRMMGWTDDGVPTPEKLYELGIGWAIDYLPKDARREAGA